MPPEPSHVLISKALDDQRLALLAVGNSDISDEQIGFLARQAIEKAMKAVLSIHHVQFRRTHDLTELIDLLKTKHIRFPQVLESTLFLTPYATQMRYDYLPPESGGEPPLDRAAIMHLVRTAIEWAKKNEA